MTQLKQDNQLAEWVSNNQHHTVRIWSQQWRLYWRADRSGYTDDVAEAGVYTTHDAVDASGHCGPEKGIYYELCAEVITQAPKGPAKLMLRVS